MKQNQSTRFYLFAPSGAFLSVVSFTPSVTTSTPITHAPNSEHCWPPVMESGPEGFTYGGDDFVTVKDPTAKEVMTMIIDGTPFRLNWSRPVTCGPAAVTHRSGRQGSKCRSKKEKEWAARERLWCANFRHLFDVHVDLAASALKTNEGKDDELPPVQMMWPPRKTPKSTPTGIKKQVRLDLSMTVFGEDKNTPSDTKWKPRQHQRQQRQEYPWTRKGKPTGRRKRHARSPPRPVSEWEFVRFEVEMQRLYRAQGGLSRAMIESSPKAGVDLDGLEQPSQPLEETVVPVVDEIGSQDLEEDEATLLPETETDHVASPILGSHPATPNHPRVPRAKAYLSTVLSALKHTFKQSSATTTTATTAGDAASTWSASTSLTCVDDEDQTKTVFASKPVLARKRHSGRRRLRDMFNRAKRPLTRSRS